jgi:small redox-active disulfide protein 1
MEVVMELLYSPVCPHCPKAKEVLLEVLEEIDGKVRFEEVNVLSREGFERAKRYGVKAVPAIIINKRRKIVGVPTKERLLKILKDEVMNRR